MLTPINPTKHGVLYQPFGRPGGHNDPPGQENVLIDFMLKAC
jgi:hypothetical protein